MKRKKFITILKSYSLSCKKAVPEEDIRFDTGTLEDSGRHSLTSES